MKKLLTSLLFFTWFLSFGQLIGVTASQSYGNSEEFVEVKYGIDNLYRFASDRLLVQPASLWKDGKTFWPGDKGQIGFNNNLQVFEYDHNHQAFYYIDVGIGTYENDPLGHPIGYIWLENNHVYVGQSNVHNDPIDIYKSIAENDIREGFVKLDSVPGDNGYPQLFTANDNKATFLLREFNGSSQFNTIVQRSDAGIEGSWTKTQITGNTVLDYRFYHSAPILYGTQTINYIPFVYRNDAGAEYFAHGLAYTSDFSTYYNAIGTYSKNVVSTSALTNAEIDTNYLINGSPAADTVNLHIMSGIQVDDTYYGLAIKSGTTDFYVFKAEDGTITDTLLDIPNLDEASMASTNSPLMYYNGLNIVYSVLCDDAGTETKELWASDLGLTSFTQKYVRSNPTSSNAIIMLPDNLNEVNGEYAMFVDYDYTTSPQSVVLVLTINKFFIIN